MTKLDALKQAIARFEGFYRPGTVPNRLNNPGDLMFAHQPGATPHPIVGRDALVREYAEFETPEDGWSALERQIRLDASRGLTLAQFIGKYAPEEDANDPKSYLTFVMREIGVADASVKLSSLILIPA